MEMTMFSNGVRGSNGDYSIGTLLTMQVMYTFPICKLD